MILTVCKEECGAEMAEIIAPPSKSQAHRLLILAALSQKKEPTNIRCDGTNDDIEATARCLCALGADIVCTEDGFSVRAIRRDEKKEGVCFLNVRESGSTLRFLLPILGALGVDADIEREGRLPDRPLAPLNEVLASHGMRLWQDEENKAILHVRTGLRGETPYAISGGVSSQNISGLLMALALEDGAKELYVKGELSSAPYVDMTLDALALCGVSYTTEKTEEGRVYRKPNTVLSIPNTLTVEGDWSSAAPILIAGALTNGVRMRGLDIRSRQGDKAILAILEAMGSIVEMGDGTVTVRPPKNGRLQPLCMDADDVPDLVPVLSVLCGAAHGESVIRGCGRLRIKESDRLAATVELLCKLGVAAFASDDTLHIFGVCEVLGRQRKERSEGTCTPPAVSDHRMVMAAAVGALYAHRSVIVEKAESISKSYPRFFEDMAAFCSITEQEFEEGMVCQASTETK